MSRGPAPGKQREWSERFRRYEKSSQTIARFCVAEGVSPASFYYWKKKLAVRGRRRPSVKRRQQSARPGNPGSGFRSVILTPPADAVSVKVRLPGGAVIELGDDPVVIQRVVDQLLQHQAGTGTDGC